MSAKIQVIPVTGVIYHAGAAASDLTENFAFNGDLPIAENDRSRHIKILENRVIKETNSTDFYRSP
ncbi:MAG: hypothetical protein U5L09_05885 [Bacteroidales bacterium]|nr:hypothetical protein [Bacteroidales bacterium]